MGYATALDLATSTNLSKAVSLHFASNCYPPIPQYMVETAVTAIYDCLSEDYRNLIDLPEGVLYKGKPQATALDIVEGQHLRAFVDALWEEYNE